MIEVGAQVRFDTGRKSFTADEGVGIGQAYRRRPRLIEDGELIRPTLHGPNDRDHQGRFRPLERTGQKPPDCGVTCGLEELRLESCNAVGGLRADPARFEAVNSPVDFNGPEGGLLGWTVAERASLRRAFRRDLIARGRGEMADVDRQPSVHFAMLTSRAARRSSDCRAGQCCALKCKQAADRDRHVAGTVR